MLNLISTVACQLIGEAYLTDCEVRSWAIAAKSTCAMMKAYRMKRHLPLALALDISNRLTAQKSSSSSSSPSSTVDDADRERMSIAGERTPTSPNPSTGCGGAASRWLIGQPVSICIESTNSPLLVHAAQLACGR
jgi:hypothetical protein